MNDSEQTPQIEGLLVVEDKAPVALQLEYLLAALGCVVVAPKSCSRQDPTILSEQPVDTAVLNLNIAGELIYPVADELTSRSLPCIFVTD